MLSNLKLSTPDAPANMAQPQSLALNPVASQGPQALSAEADALRLTLNRQNLQLAYARGINVDPMDVWTAVRMEARNAG